MTCGPQFGAPAVWGGAARPENLVVARSSAPQNRCTGEDFPTKLVRNSLRTRPAVVRSCQKRATASASYDACSRSDSNGTASGISTGTGQMSVSIRAARIAAVTSA